MAIRAMTLVVIFLILVASIQLPKANADLKDCSEMCRERCLTINSDSIACTTTCNNLCDPKATSGRRSLLRPSPRKGLKPTNGHMVDRIRRRPKLDWVKH